mmetsp:Transcript_70028/g.226556  ORF Transcript_70028/g.226556 Transcript_70028/m.226556 type:complete len:250 (-) Transcript_70028:292-1041(-)
MPQQANPRCCRWPGAAGGSAATAVPHDHGRHARCTGPWPRTGATRPWARRHKPARPLCHWLHPVLSVPTPIHDCSPRRRGSGPHRRTPAAGLLRPSGVSMPGCAACRRARRVASRVSTSTHSKSATDPHHYRIGSKSRRECRRRRLAGQNAGASASAEACWPATHPRSQAHGGVSCSRPPSDCPAQPHPARGRAWLLQAKRLRSTTLTSHLLWGPLPPEVIALRSKARGTGRHGVPMPARSPASDAQGK